MLCLSHVDFNRLLLIYLFTRPCVFIIIGIVSNEFINIVLISHFKSDKKL